MKPNNREYENALVKLEELLPLVDDSTPKDHPNYAELIKVSALIEAYEKEHYPIELPTLTDTIRLRMFELNLKQKDLAKLLGVSAARISEYLKGTRQITLEVAKKLHKELGIDAEIILQ